MDVKTLKPIIESLIMASARPISLERILSCFAEKEVPDKKIIRSALKLLAEDYAKLNSSVELKEVSSGYRFQVRKEYSLWAAKLWEEKPARYSRALLETLSLVAYKQPISRGEIEKIRGVSVSTQIMKTLIEREWVHIVGHRDVPGKPAIYATTKEFLDYFNLVSLEELPPLAEIRDIDKINGELDLPEPVTADSDKDQSTQEQSTNLSESGSDASTISTDEDSATVVKLDTDEDLQSTTDTDDSNDKNTDEVKVAEAMTAEH